MSQTFSFELDMDKSRRSPQMVAARVGDMGSIKINASLVLDGSAYTPTGTNAYFECITNAGTSVRVPATKSGSTVSVNIPSQALCKPGVITCAYFRFENGTTEDPTFVESTQSFGIIVPTSIDDEIDAEDYLGEWRALEQQLQDYVDEVSAAATQAKKDISSDTSAVESAKSSAISSINADKQEVADAAANVMKPINDALDQFSEDSQSAIDSFNSKGTSAIGAFNSSSANAVSQFNTKGTNAVNSFNTKGNQAVSTFNSNGTQKIQEFDDAADTKLASVDKMISQAQSDVDADIAALQKATQDAIDAMEAALSEDQYGEILQRLNRVWKLSHQDMSAIQNNADLNTLKSVGCYVCQTNAAALSLQNKPEDLSVAFFLYVLSVQATGVYQYYTQLIIPYMPQAGKMKLYARTFDLKENVWGEWAEVGSGADITAGEGIIVTGDDTKQVALDPDAFHESIEGAELASFDTSVTGGGSVQEMTVYGNTVQNLWANPSGTNNGVTVTANEDGSVTLSGANAGGVTIYSGSIYTLKPNTRYVAFVDKPIVGSTSSHISFAVIGVRIGDNENNNAHFGYEGGQSISFTTGNILSANCRCIFYVNAAVDVGTKFSGTYRVMLREATEDEISQNKVLDTMWCPPGLSSIDNVEVVTAGKNLWGNPSGTNGGVTATANYDGTITVGGTNASQSTIYVMSSGYILDVKEGETFTLSCEGIAGSSGYGFMAVGYNDQDVQTPEDRALAHVHGTRLQQSFTIPSGTTKLQARLVVQARVTVSGTYKVMLNRGETVDEWEPSAVTSTPIDLQGHTLNALPDGTRDELHIDGGGNVVLEKRVGSVDNTNSFEAYGAIPPCFGCSDASYAMAGNGRNVLANGLKFVLGGGTRQWPNYAVGLASNVGITRVYVKGAEDDATASDLKDTMESVNALVLYPLAEPQTIDLGKVYLSPVSSGQLNVWVNGASGGTNFTPPVTVDVVANKVDYRLTQPVDLSSKEDAFDVLPVSKGGTGTTSAQAERNRLGLGNTTGALPIANGGTGSTSAANARSALGITPANIGAAPASHTHNYAGSTSAGGAATSANKVNATSLANVDLNDYRTEGTFYYGGGGNGCSNKPSGVDAFGMVVMRSASGYYTQLLHSIDDEWFFRQYGGGTWTTWNRLYSTNSKPTPSELGAAASSHSHDAGNITSGTLPVARGGTGTTSAQAERNRLGLGNTTGALPIANGGTGATSASNAANAILGGITGSTHTLSSTAEFFIDDGGVPSRLEYLTMVSDIGVRLLGNSTSNAQVKFLTVENVGGTLAGVASNVYEFIYDCDNDGNEFLCLAKFTATIAGQSFNVGLVGRLEKDLSNGGPTIYMSGIGWPTSADSVSDNDAGLLLVHAFTNVTRTSMSFTSSSLYFLGIKVVTTSNSWPPSSSYNVYGARYNSSNFSFNRMLLLGYDSKMVI